MDKRKLIYFALGSLLMLPSCSQDSPADSGHTGDNNRIYFRSYLPAVSLTRAEVISKDNFNTCQVTCINPTDSIFIDPETGEITPYFTDVHFEKDPKAGDGRFISTGGNVCRWPDTESKLHFFAYYPSADSMRNVCGDDFFIHKNATALIDGKANIDYRLEKFRVAKDIAKQADFLTAYAVGTTSENSEEGINLNFTHQLARLELSAWGANEKYDFEIAGVRIGNPVVEGDFNFSALMPDATDKNLWYNTIGKAGVEYIFTQGESLVRISGTDATHSTEATAASIMGKGGPAMVIPMAEKIEAWEGKDDPATASGESYSTDKLYFSVLLRVKNKAGNTVYPYPNEADDRAVIYFAVEPDEANPTVTVIKERLFEIDGDFYTADEKNEEYLYVPNELQTICSFGWAALPVAAKWEAGKIYTYKLNYSNGIGWHDPSDPHPGEPIIERGAVPFKVSVEEWVKAEGYDPTWTVPNK